MMYAEVLEGLRECKWDQLCSDFHDWMKKNNCPVSLDKLAADFLGTLPVDSPEDYLRGMLVVHLGRVCNYTDDVMRMSMLTTLKLSPEQVHAVRTRDMMDALLSLAATVALAGKLNLRNPEDGNPFDAFLHIEVAE